MPQTYTNLSSLFTAIANSIRSVTGSSAQIVADTFPQQITNISTSIKVGTASAADVRNGKTFTNATTVGGTGSMPDSTTGTASSGTLVATKTPSTTIQYVNLTAGYTPARYWKISAISTQTKSITASTATQTVNADSGKYLTAVTVNPQSHSGTYNAKRVVANTRIDLTGSHNYRYIDFYGYDYDMAAMTDSGSNKIQFTAPWGTTSFYYGYWKVPAKFYCRVFMFHGENSKIHGYLDFAGSTFHSRVDDTNYTFAMQNSTVAQTTWNSTNNGWYRGTYNGSSLYPNSTIYVASQTASPAIKGFYGGFWVA